MDLALIVPPEFVWPEPWNAVGDDAARLEEELRRELPIGHVLAGLQFVAKARHRRFDDVIFATSHDSLPVAIVHLTWKGSTEFHDQFPRTEQYSNLESALLSWARKEESD